MDSPRNLIEVKDLVVTFRRRSAKRISFRPETFAAVDHVSFSIRQGETYGLVGESGSGKSTIGRAILGYFRPAAGQILYQGKDIAGLKAKERAPYQRRMQSVFQDPYSSLDPSMNVAQIIGEPMEIQRMYPGKARRERIASLLESVGLSPDDMNRYPSEFSGGQRQRISIARALAVAPEFIVCDEPISALDVSLQAQIIYLLQDLQRTNHLTYLFISHQLQIIRKICSQIGVLYLGSLLETGSAQDVCGAPIHPYTRMLMSSVLEPDPELHSLDSIPKDSGTQQYSGKGCKFASRCPFAADRCRQEMPVLTDFGGGHQAACFRAGEI